MEFLTMRGILADIVLVYSRLRKDCGMVDDKGV